MNDVLNEKDERLSRIREVVLASKDVKFLYRVFGEIFTKIRCKGYSVFESMRFTWEMILKTDWVRYGSGALDPKVRAESLPNKDKDIQEDETIMEVALRTSRSGYSTSYYNVFVDTDNVRSVAGALGLLGISWEDISTEEAYERLPGNPIFFRIDGAYNPETGRMISEILKCLVVIEDSWDLNGSAVFFNGTEAELGKDYDAKFTLYEGDERDYFDTEFMVLKPDGSRFAEGGCGMVHVDQLGSYLKPFGFTDESLKEIGYLVF